jgi:hypothetical protein
MGKGLGFLLVTELALVKVDRYVCMDVVYYYEGSAVNHYSVNMHAYSKKTTFNKLAMDLYRCFSNKPISRIVPTVFPSCWDRLVTTKF